MSIAKSVVITCAGTGSRLGMGQAKSLININGKSLVAWQLEIFKEVEDLRIVVGYQASDVIGEVLKYRNDVIFAYNHRYLETKTGASFFLGAQHANEFVIEWNGDLLVHPEDVRTLLSLDCEYICYSDKSSEEPILVKIDETGNVISFSRNEGDYEWTGPACIRKNKLSYSPRNVFNQLELFLPMKGIKIRAYDIDTYQDYINVVNITKDWMQL
jgi:choline kinase